MSQNAAVATSRRTLGVLVPVALLALIIGVAAEPALADTCEDLQTLSLPHTTIAFAQSEPAGTFAPPVGPPLTGLPAFCRVVGAALMEAQRFPADFDGIVAGAPANFWTHLLFDAAWTQQALLAPGSYIGPAKLPAVQAAALAACDLVEDNIQDGIVADPRDCT